MRAQRFLETDTIILGILVIGVLGLVDLSPVVHQQVVIDLPRPRSLLETEADVRFARLRQHILTLIRKEARLTMEQETVLNTP